jgi:superoxide dismutase, Fe-Mn family
LALDELASSSAHWCTPLPLWDDMSVATDTSLFILSTEPLKLSSSQPNHSPALYRHLILQETLEIHWGKHHAAYVNNLNNQIKGKDLESMSLVEVMLKSWNGGKPTPEFNNAAQVVNHTFFWESLSPSGGGEPTGKLAEAITRDFGSFATFKEQFSAAGATQFGSGWAWLTVGDGGKLEINKTPNAENPWVHGKTPVLTMDVWEVGSTFFLLFCERLWVYLKAF